jgi:aminoglycoside phosphotransferase (APT) family kinase protein
MIPCSYSDQTLTDRSHSLRGTRYILRKKPAGTIISPVAHQVDREYRVLKALGSVDGFPVPRVYTLCMDSNVIGTPFYVCPLAPNSQRP